MSVIVAEEAADAVCRFAEQPRSTTPDAGTSLRAWRARFPQRLQIPKSGQPLSLGNCGDGGAGRAKQNLSLWLELIEACNLNCVFCYNPWRPPDSPLRKNLLLSPGQLQDCLRRIFERVSISHVTLSGGEPLLYPQIESLTQYVSRHCQGVAMTTNGRSLTRRRVTSLKVAGLDSISVPVHSNSAAVHDQLAGGRSWRAAVRALALSVESGLTTSLSCVVTRKNSENVGVVAEMALGLGIRTIILNCFHATGQGAGQQDLEVTDSEFWALVETLREDVREAANVLVGSPPPLSANKRRKEVTRITVSPFGELKLCGQSSRGVVNVRTEPDQFEEFLNAVSRNDFSGYVDRIDSCTCR